jgi:elongation factor 1 alpha-like protein
MIANPAAGHVDSGKSTLMGRLLFDLGAIDERTMEEYKREAEKMGKASFAFAWVLDQGTEERARGVTMDIATNRFETERTAFTILDAPGHRDFVPNMISGASQADFAVLVIDASTGEFEAGLRGQTKEHALLVRSMGVSRLVIAVNKMDRTDWSESRFQDIQQQMMAFLTTAGFKAEDLSFVPCSGLEGDNIIHRSMTPQADWYSGKTLVDELDTSEPINHALEKPLRMTIADIFEESTQNPISISGRIEAGSLQVGDQLVIMPSGEKAFVRSIQVDDEPSDWAVAGQNVILNITEIDLDQIKEGDMICSVESPATNVTSFTAKVLAFNYLAPMPLDVHRGGLRRPGKISRLVAVLDKIDGNITKKKPKIVHPGNVARVVVDLESPAPIEGGRIVLRAEGETVAAGLLE